MDIRNLEYFIEVARHKSFSKAAEAIHISQPGISKAIKELEAQWGVVLFYRNAKNIELTDSGEVILEQAQQIVSAFYNITVQLDGLAKMQVGKLYIGVPPITAVTALSRLLSAFRNEYPKIQVHLYEFGPKKIEAAIQEGQLDIGIFTPAEQDEQYEKLWLERDPHDIIMQPKHRLAQEEVVDYKQLSNEQFIIYNNEYRLHDLIISRCQQAGFTPKIVLETSQRDLITQMVADDLGIALLPRKLCKSLDARMLISRPLVDPQLYLKLAFVWKKARYLSHAVRQFLDFVRKNAPQT
ncbi:LysR family transcriptional regulator [Sporomusa sp.]|uniref:LysR family transcriptional regulator n=1 Tax=Sporomusa sp. TaxID=2078658 RepID=UPI002C8B80A6|nr:LysR family transcriptional regulator [Sporomusa sp.]HWR06446.1 LysR family transcriptional regulator [Sporomusa sp.]